ncbi:Hypothetical_protein [Hexamita inflata]|uniref:Hypothetical_protein n=1 Tax=Hexamita inflata TaxID=28002 RepID=A0AA86TIG2_9EUKA|nr:Hypothetical protein HINF_LOCUS6135 [Hexamita inflata]
MEISLKTASIAATLSWLLSTPSRSQNGRSAESNRNSDMLQTCAEPLFVSNPAGCGYPVHPSYSHVRTTTRAKPKATERQERQEGRHQEGAEEVSFDSILIKYSSCWYFTQNDSEVCTGLKSRMSASLLASESCFLNLNFPIY